MLIKISLSEYFYVEIWLLSKQLKEQKPFTFKGISFLCLWETYWKRAPILKNAPFNSQALCVWGKFWALWSKQNYSGADTINNNTSPWDGLIVVRLREYIPAYGLHRFIGQFSKSRKWARATKSFPSLIRPHCRNSAVRPQIMGWGKGAAISQVRNEINLP